MSDRPPGEVSVPLWELDMENRLLGDRKLRDLKPGSKFFLGDLLFKVLDVREPDGPLGQVGLPAAEGS